MRPWFARRRCPVDASDRRLIPADSSWRLTSAPVSKKLSQMNRYGRRLMRQMQETDPTRFASLPDPEQHFTMLGEQLGVEIEQLAQSIAGPDRPGETYLEKVGRLNMARLNAESDLIAEAMIRDPEDPEIDQRPADDLTTLANRETHRILFEEDDPEQ
jgi:hypothetical protein